MDSLLLYICMYCMHVLYAYTVTKNQINTNLMLLSRLKVFNFLINTFLCNLNYLKSNLLIFKEMHSRTLM